MRKMYFLSTVVILGMLLASIAPVFAPASKAHDLIWADGQIWDTVLTPATFKAPKNPNSVDVLFVFDESGLDGQRPIGEAASYEDDYNGGRWWVHLVVFTETGLAVHDAIVDGTVDLELMSDDEVMAHFDLGHLTFIPTDTYFVCPLVTFEE